MTPLQEHSTIRRFPSVRITGITVSGLTATVYVTSGITANDCDDLCEALRRALGSQESPVSTSSAKTETGRSITIRKMNCSWMNASVWESLVRAYLGVADKTNAMPSRFNMDWYPEALAGIKETASTLGANKQAQSPTVAPGAKPTGTQHSTATNATGKVPAADTLSTLIAAFGNRTSNASVTITTVNADGTISQEHTCLQLGRQTPLSDVASMLGVIATDATLFGGSRMGNLRR